MWLNAEKVRLRQNEVPFIGYVATGEGLCADPAKVHTILGMTTPTDVPGVQRLQYLSKFLPGLSDMIKPLRVLTRKDVLWSWDEPQQKALDDLKRAMVCTPVLRYYNLHDEVTLQCDAFQHGLGATLLQNGQPAAYAWRALMQPETHYAQIKKELLAIMFACNHFEPYIFGREGVNVETDHQPLEIIVGKPLNSAPKQIQRMLLQLQKYSLRVKYNKGTQLYLADTLSWAHLPETPASELVLEVAAIDNTSSLALPAERLHQIQHASADDPILKALRDAILSSWPACKSDITEPLHAYHDF